jgi:hypothetical protein
MSILKCSDCQYRESERTEDEKNIIGTHLAEILMLKEDKGNNPRRYKTTWGNKTPRGLYETIKRILETKF